MSAPLRKWPWLLALAGSLALGFGLATASDVGAGAAPGRTTIEVPLPPTVWLFISGLGSLAVLKAIRVTRRRQHPRSGDPPAG